MKRALLSLMALVIAGATLVGCSQRIGDFTMVTTKNYERNVKYKMVGRTVGEDKVLVILGIPTGVPNMKTAVDHAIEKGSGVYLANAVIEVGGWSAILVGEQGYTVTGDCYAPAEQGDLMNPAIEKFSIKSSDQGAVMVSDKDGQEVAVKNFAGLTIVK